MRLKFKIDRPPSLALMAQIAAATLGAGVIAAAGYGFGASSNPAPRSCSVAFALADKTFVDYENVTTAIVLMKSRGQSEYEGHEADAIQLWDDIDAARADYRVAKAECVGGAV